MKDGKCACDILTNEVAYITRHRSIADVEFLCCGDWADLRFEVANDEHQSFSED
jgi:hypothetical protein